MINLNNKVIAKDNRWYLLRTKFRQEKKAAKELMQQKFVVFLPLCQREKLVRKKVVIKEEPLFARYLFISLNIEQTNWTSIRSTRGISNFVEFGDGPTRVPDEIVKELKAINLLTIEPRLRIGETVKILDGPFTGLNAIYQAPNGDSRAHILITFLQQKQHLSIESKSLKLF